MTDKTRYIQFQTKNDTRNSVALGSDNKNLEAQRSKFLGCVDDKLYCKMHVDTWKQIKFSHVR